MQRCISSSIESMGAPRSYRRCARIFGETEPADFLYKVVSGAVRAYQVLPNGKQHISAFYLPGDFFGLEAGETYTLSVESIADSTFLAIKHGAVAALATGDGAIAYQLYVLATLEIERLREHALLVAKTAPERVAGFLLEMGKRFPGSDEVELPMSRQDIADHLGLTVETVSRALAQLARDAIIALPSSRRIELRKCKALNGPIAVVRQRRRRV